MRRPALFIAHFSIICGTAIAAEGALTASEQSLRKLLGDSTPTPISLWPGKPPKFLEDAPADSVDGNRHITMVSVPTKAATASAISSHVG
jgi:hypothetical protein